jgi:hypothetical protein
MNKANTEYLHRRNHEPFEMRKNHNELLLQEDALIFLLHSEHIFTPPNFVLVAHPSATSESSLYRSDGDFSSSDVPGSQYSSLRQVLTCRLFYAYSSDIEIRRWEQEASRER